MVKKGNWDLEILIRKEIIENYIKNIYGSHHIQNAMVNPTEYVSSVQKRNYRVKKVQHNMRGKIVDSYLKTMFLVIKGYISLHHIHWLHGKTLLSLDVFVVCFDWKRFGAVQRRAEPRMFILYKIYFSSVLNVKVGLYSRFYPTVYRVLYYINWIMLFCFCFLFVSEQLALG